MDKSVDTQKMLRDILYSYYYSTGIPVFSIDFEGNTGVRSCECAGICKFLNDYLKESSPCSQAHLYASKQAESIGDAYVFFCPAGLVHYTTPIIRNDLFTGAILAGPILLDYPDQIAVDGIIQKYNMSVNMRGKIGSFLQAVPVVEASRVRYLSRLLFFITSGMLSLNEHILFERRESMDQQSQISGSIQDIKEYSDKDYYPYEMEKELQIKVKNGDVTGAKTVLNQLLGHIFFTSGGKIEIMKARTLELCTLLSRAAVEGGGALDTIFGMNYEFINKLYKIKNIEELSYWILRVLYIYSEKVFDLGSIKNAELIKAAIKYINENYKNDITLADISGYIKLNPSYFSAIFKKETGIGFSDYVNKVRVDESKRLLSDTRISILDIALDVGFESQSYFTKVFKKFTGMTPKQYREKQP